MAKKTKGKQKDQARQQPPAASPLYISLGSPLHAEPEQTKTLPKINTALVHPPGPSPMTEYHEVASGSHPADNWAAQGASYLPDYLTDV